MHIVLQNDRGGHGELPMAFTHSWVGFVKGAVLGAIVGLLFGIGFTLFQWEQLTPLFIAPFVLFGSVLGAFGGVIVGASNPAISIDETERQGGVALLVESTDAEEVQWASRELVKFGGILLEAGSEPNGALEAPRSPSITSRA